MASREELYARVWYGERDKIVEIGVNLRDLNKPGSPVYRMLDNGCPMFVIAVAVIASWIWGNWMLALAMTASGVILLLTSINILVMLRLRNRALAFALSGPDGWEELWGRGGLTLRLTGDEASQIESPAGDWQAFARRRLPPTGQDIDALARED